MGTVADKLNKLLSTKEDIRAAITEKGQTVADTDTFSSYADKIRGIKSTSGVNVPVTVITDPGVILTATKGNTTVTGTVDSSGIGKIFLEDSGDWDIVSTLGTNSKSVIFNIPKDIKVTMPTLLVPDTFEILQSLELGFRSSTDYTGIIVAINSSKIGNNKILIDWENNSDTKGLSTILGTNTYTGVYCVATTSSLSIGTYPQYTFIEGATISYNTTIRHILELQLTTSTVSFNSGNVSNRVTGTTTGLNSMNKLSFALSPSYSNPYTPIESLTLYGAKVENPTTNALTYNWIPVKRKSDGVLGLYDTIGGTFSPVITKP